MHTQFLHNSYAFILCIVTEHIAEYISDDGGVCGLGTPDVGTDEQRWRFLTGA